MKQLEAINIFLFIKYNISCKKNLKEKFIASLGLLKFIYLRIHFFIIFYLKDNQNSSSNVILFIYELLKFYVKDLKPFFLTRLARPYRNFFKNL